MISHGHVSRDPPSNNETRQMCANPPFGLCNIRRIMFHLTYDLLPLLPLQTTTTILLYFHPPLPNFENEMNFSGESLMKSAGNGRDFAHLKPRPRSPSKRVGGGHRSEVNAG